MEIEDWQEEMEVATDQLIVAIKDMRKLLFLEKSIETPGSIEIFKTMSCTTMKLRRELDIDKEIVDLLQKIVAQAMACQLGGVQ